MRAVAKLENGMVIAVDLPADAESVTEWDAVSVTYPNGAKTYAASVLGVIVDGFNDEDHEAVIAEIEAQIKWHKENP